jgi:hypothetical protein
MIRCTSEERKGLEGLEKGLKDNEALKHLETDADDDADDDETDAPLKQGARA